MKTKRLLSLLLALVLCLSLLPTAFAEGTGSFTVELTCTVDLDGARSMLPMVNTLRTGEDAWQLDENEQRVELPGLSELSYSYDLEEIALQRAVEIALSFSHTRPNGEKCFTCLATDGNRSWGENIAAGYTTAAAAFEGWCETNEDYEGQGHRRNMLKDSFVSIGIAHVVVNGTHYWVQEFSYDPIPGADAQTAGERTCTVDITGGSVSSCGTATVEPAALSLTVGETAAVPVASAALQLTGAWPSRTTTVRETPDWQSGDTGVVTVENGVVTAVGAGETTLTATAFGDQSVTVPVTVTAAQTLEDGHYLIGPDWTVNAIDPTRKFEPNPHAEGEWMLTTTLTEGEKIKVVKVVNGQINAWYPDGYDNEYTVDAAHAGNVTVYFRNAYHPDWASFGGYIYIGAALTPDYAEVYGASLSLKGNIGLNFYVFLPESAAYVTLDGEQFPVSEEDGMDIDGRTAYCFSAEVPAKEMGRQVTLRVYDGEGQAVTLMLHEEDLTETGFSYSVRDYLDRQIDEGEESALRDLCIAMRDYGSCAQVVFDYDAENRAELVNEDELDQVTVDALSEFEPNLGDAEGGVTYVGSSLLLKSETTLRHYFRLTDGEIGDYVFEVDFGDGYVQVTPVQSGNNWYVEIPNIPARDLDKAFAVSVEKDGQNLILMDYRPLSYAYKALTKEGVDPAVQQQMQALYLYWQAAESYFDSIL